MMPDRLSELVRGRDKYKVVGDYERVKIEGIAGLPRSASGNESVPSSPAKSDSHVTRIKCKTPPGSACDSLTTSKIGSRQSISLAGSQTGAVAIGYRIGGDRAKMASHQADLAAEKRNSLHTKCRAKIMTDLGFVSDATNPYPGKLF